MSSPLFRLLSSPLFSALFSVLFSNLFSSFSFSFPFSFSCVVLDLVLSPSLSPSLLSHLLALLSERVEEEFLGRRVRGIKGVVVTVKQGWAKGIASVKELRSGLEKMREMGVKVVVYVETFGEVESGWLLYYLASVADRVYVGRSGMVGLNGLMMATPFLMRALKNWMIEPYVGRRKGYKSAANLYVRENYDDGQKEVVSYIVNTIWDEVADKISKGRGIFLEKVKELLENGPYSPQEALNLGLVDGIAYRSQVYDYLDDIFLEDAKPDFEIPYPKLGLNYFFKSHVRLLYAELFVDRNGPSKFLSSGPKVAVLTLKGSIHSGHSSMNWRTREFSSIGSDTALILLRQLSRDQSFKAVILRIDSGGGSYIASDHIFRAILDLKESKKKVICVMENYAASGGYFLAMAADYIVCNPLTLTGSIGVVAGKMNFRPFLESKLGITYDQVTTSDRATLFSSLYSYNEDQLAFLDKTLDYIYDDFTGKVAKSRHLSREKVEELAQGRVWMGESALNLGLVDSVGDFNTAVKATCNLLKVNTVNLFSYPKPASFLERLFNANPSNSDNETYGMGGFAFVDQLSFLFNSMLGTVQMVNDVSSLMKQSTSLQILQRASSFMNPNEENIADTFQASMNSEIYSSLERFSRA